MKTKKRYPVMMFLFSLLLLLAACDYKPAVVQSEESTRMKQEEEKKTVMDTEETKQQEDSEQSTLYVHVCGCVKNPGLYELPAGSRTDAAVKAAGGFSLDARQNAVNLAAVLTDGMQLYIPSELEDMETEQQDANSLQSGSCSYAEGDNSSGLVNINTAELSDLMTLSGIGEGKAKAILAYREENGSFQTIEDVKNVNGIGDGIFEKIRGSITV